MHNSSHIVLARSSSNRCFCRSTNKPLEPSTPSSASYQRAAVVVGTDQPAYTKIEYGQMCLCDPSDDYLQRSNRT